MVNASLIAGGSNSIALASAVSFATTAGVAPAPLVATVQTPPGFAISGSGGGQAELPSAEGAPASEAVLLPLEKPPAAGISALWRPSPPRETTPPSAPVIRDLLVPHETTPREERKEIPIRHRVTRTADMAAARIFGPRGRQQDFYLVREIATSDPPATVAVVADGHGILGAIVSREAVLSFTETLAARLQAHPSLPATEALAAALSTAESHVNEVISAAAAEQRVSLDDITSGTMLTALLLWRQGIFAIHIGDSRLYRSSSAEPLAVLTTDHPITVGGTPFPRALGHPELKAQGLLSAQPDIFVVERRGVDETYLLGSDGLSVLPLETIAAAVDNGSSLRVVEALLRAVYPRARDNVTLLALKPR